METLRHYEFTEGSPIYKALALLIDYLWQAEVEDFDATEEGERHRHIFHDVALVSRWLTNPTREPDYFGDCPKCEGGGNDGYLNLGRSNWIICHLHQLRWCIGDLLSSWRFETEEDWDQNWKRIGHYEQIPIPMNNCFLNK